MTYRHLSIHICTGWHWSEKIKQQLGLKLLLQFPQSQGSCPRQCLGLLALVERVFPFVFLSDALCTGDVP